MLTDSREVEQSKSQEGQKPLCVDLFCGLGGWAEGFLAEGYTVIGFDIVRWPYPGFLVLQDVRTLHGSQFSTAAVIVASPPCNEYSYRGMPWKRARALPPPSNELFDACFRIQREACEAAGNHIPMVVENVCKAQKWVGRARWHFGSYYLWGDVPALMPSPKEIKSEHVKVARQDWNRFKRTGAVSPHCRMEAQKSNPDGTAHPPGSWFKIADSKNRRARSDAVKQQGSGPERFDNGISKLPSRSMSRKEASALIAKIPFALAQYIARCYKPIPER